MQLVPNAPSWTKSSVARLAQGVGLTLVLAITSACNLPRTAAIQQEVVSQSASENPTFQVVEVTRASSAQVNSWPKPSHHEHRTWFHADRGPDSSVIQTGDTIRVIIWDNQENSLISNGEKQTPIAPLSVSSAGTVFLPYVGDVRVRGLTSGAARNKIQSELEMIVPAAQVQLSLEPGRNNSVDVSQGVQAPGRYPLDSRNVQLLSVLSLAGGINTSLRNPRVQLQRNGQLYETRIEDILEHPAKNVRMRGGDLVAIVEDDRSFNSVGASGRQELIFFEKEHMSAMDGVSAAGGIDGRRGNPQGVLILRDYHPRDLTPGPTGPDMQQVVFAFDLTSADGLFAARNFTLEPNDTLLMSESPFAAAQTIANFIGNLTGIGLTAQRISD
ncbi:MAG: polysaccharide biosynthesis/export family protein [Pseudomonadota bacterium]